MDKIVHIMIQFIDKIMENRKTLINMSKNILKIVYPHTQMPHHCKTEKTNDKPENCNLMIDKM